MYFVHRFVPDGCLRYYRVLQAPLAYRRAHDLPTPAFQRGSPRRRTFRRRRPARGRHSTVVYQDYDMTRRTP